MPLAIMLLPTTASPSPAHFADAVKAVVRERAAYVRPDKSFRTVDGVLFKFDGETIWPDRVSAGVCSLVFDAARRTNSYVLTAGGDEPPLMIAGSKGKAPKGVGRAKVVQDPTALCTDLRTREAAWRRFVAQEQSSGWMDSHENLMTPPGDPGGEARIQSDTSGVAIECAAQVQPMLKRMKWRMLRATVSRNPRWGVVWRADVQSLQAPKTLFREICWRARDGSLAVMSRPLDMFDPAETIDPLKP